MKTPRYFRFWKNPFYDPRLYIHVVVFVILVLVSVGATFSKSKVIQKNMPLAWDKTLVVEETKPSPVVVAFLVATPAPKVKGTTDTKSSPSIAPVPSQVLIARGSSNPLCKGVGEQWKMIADPAHGGQYVICNTVVEKMASVAELNSEQNNYRKNHGLNALNINDALCKIAASRAQEVSKNFSHDGFEAAVENSGIGKKSYGENIASGPLSAVHFVEYSWDKSPGHKANMLGDWLDGCAGVADKYAVFLFAK